MWCTRRVLRFLVEVCQHLFLKLVLSIVNYLNLILVDSSLYQDIP